MINRRSFISKSGSALVAATLPGPTFSHASPGSARILVGFPAGGTIDSVARLVAEHMKTSNPSIVVENRPGAGGRMALVALKSSPADGSILALTPGDQLTLFPHVYSQLDYRPFDDFAPITTVCTTEFLLTAGPMVPSTVKTLADFIVWCRKNPNKASYGSPGSATRPHFVGVALKNAAAFSFEHVAYKGGTAAVQDMLGGHIASYIGTIGNSLSVIQEGSVRALATSAPVRNPILPDVPTFREAGYARAEAVEWFGFLAPARTPPSTVEKIRFTIHSALQSEKVRAGLDKLSLNIRSSSSEELATLIRSDAHRSGEIVAASGFKPME